MRICRGELPGVGGGVGGEGCAACDDRGGRCSAIPCVGVHTADDAQGSVQACVLMCAAVSVNRL